MWVLVMITKKGNIKFLSILFFLLLYHLHLANAEELMSKLEEKKKNSK